MLVKATDEAKYGEKIMIEITPKFYEAKATKKSLLDYLRDLI